MSRLPLTDADRSLIAASLPQIEAVRGVEGFEIEPLAQHASNRSYHRVHLRGGQGSNESGLSSLVVMKLGEEPLRSDERVEGAAPTRLPFLEVGEALAAANVPVPRLFLDRVDQGILLLEDLGDETFEARLLETPRAQWIDWYRDAVRLLVRVHAAEPELRRRGSIATARTFGANLLRWELEHFREWGLEARGVRLSPAETRVLDTAFDQIVDRLTSLPYGLSHRDYQSRNLMVTANGLRVIDFQDALMAPVVYDLVALLRDSYIVLTPDEVQGALETYAVARAETPSLPRVTVDEIREAFLWMTVQRKLKDSGRFVFIDRVKGDPSFLVHIPDSLTYVREALEGLPELRELHDVLLARVPEWAEGDAR